MAPAAPRYPKQKAAAMQLLNQGRYAEAAAMLAPLCAKQPRDPESHGALGYCLLHLGRLAEAVAAYRRVVRLVPRAWRAHADLANALRFAGSFQEAVDANQEAIRLNPSAAVLWDNLGICLCSQGRIDEAAAAHRKAMELDPASFRAHSNLLLTLHYQAAADPAVLLADHRAWGAAHGVAGAAPHFQNRRDPERRLRVGYLSADLRTHSVAYFLEPLLAHHDHAQVEVYAYAHLPGGDATTERLHGWVDQWRWVAGLAPHALVRRLRDDRLDLLVELGGHTSSELLVACALRAAPVQVTYLGYPDTTGVPALDYRLVDEITDPPGAEVWATERLVRLPGCFLCFCPSAEAPPVAPLPAATRGHVTFGSFNNLAKINVAVVDLWCQLLARLPAARLLVKNPSFDDPPTRGRYAAWFAARGIDAGRVELRGPTEQVADHLALYGEVDIALDTFPYNGTTTTCEALWQGVPVVTLAGNLHMGRVGASLLQAAGHPEWVAATEAEYLAAATGLAADVDRLGRLRAGLRQAVAASPLADGAAFVPRVEAAYRALWRGWCATPA